MSTFDIMDKVESQAVQLERARAVLAEVEHYFDNKGHVKYLPHYAEHILLLLHVADSLLHGILPELNEATAQLQKLHKEELVA